jgi:hypothetical protein
MEPSTFTETRVSCSAEGACLQSRVCTPCMLFKNKYVCIATADTVWRYGYLVQTDLTMQTMCGIEPCPHRIIKPAVMHGHSINMQEHAVDLHAPPPINLTCMHACIHADRCMHACSRGNPYWPPFLQRDTIVLVLLVATVTCILTGTRLHFGVRPISRIKSASSQC